MSEIVIDKLLKRLLMHSHGSSGIENGAITLIKMADMASASLIYRKTAGAGVPEVNTLATLKIDLDLSGTNTGDQTNISGNAATVTTNANLTGIVTSIGNATAIADNALSIAKTSGLQTALDSKLNLTGGTLTGNLSMASNLIFDGTRKIIGGTGTTADLTFQTTSGVGATGSDMHFLVGNNGGTEALTILNNGNVGIGATGSFGARLTIGGSSGYDGGLFVTKGISNTTRIANFGDVLEITSGGGASWVGQGIRIDGVNRAFQFVASASITLDDYAFSVDTSNNSTIFSNPLSGAKELFRVGINANFIPTSGSATFATQRIRGSVNQTGGANGITRGLWLDSIITAAADWRSLEITPNTGYSIYQSGALGKVYLNGDTSIGTTAVADSAKLYVSGKFSSSGEAEINGDLNHDGTNVGFYSVAPVARATTGVAASTFAANTSGIANDTATWDSYTMGQVVTALRNVGILT